MAVVMLLLAISISSCMSWVLELTPCELDTEALPATAPGGRGSGEAKMGRRRASRSPASEIDCSSSLSQLSKSLASVISHAGAATAPEAQEDAGGRQDVHPRLVWRVSPSS